MEREPTTLQAVAELQTQMSNMEKRMRSEIQGEMNRMREDLQSQNRELQSQNQELQTQTQELQSQTQELQSQNQLLLSKISALSSQNSNAPGIFDGADRRKMEAKHEQLRQSGQKVAPTVRHRQLAFFDMECEFLKNCDTDCSFSSV